MQKLFHINGIIWVLCLCMNMFVTHMDYAVFIFSKSRQAGRVLSPSNLKLGISKVPDSNTGNEVPKSPQNWYQMESGLPRTGDRAAQKITA